jgi:HAMP domain-containing protein
LNSPRQLAAALGAGFYRYWHVPAPDASLDAHDTRRADLSLIGPGAVALLAAGAWTAGQAGTALLLEQRLSAPLDALPWVARVLVLTGAVGALVALAWWLGTARVRARVARGVAAGSVARIPDNPDDDTEPLHAAVSRLGRTLRDRPPAPDAPAAEPAFDVLRAGASVLTAPDGGPAPERHRLRHRCLTLAHRLEHGHLEEGHLVDGRPAGAAAPGPGTGGEPGGETVRDAG